MPDQDSPATDHQPPWANAIAIFVFAAGVGIATDVAYQSALIASADGDPQTKKAIIDEALNRLKVLRDIGYYVALLGAAVIVNRLVRALRWEWLFVAFLAVGAVGAALRLLGIWR